MKADQRHITDEMLVKYLLGEASGTEKAQIQRWVDENDTNKKHFYHFKLIWDESRNLAAASTVNENEAWARFQQRTQKPERRTIPFPGLPKWLKIAAAILIIAGAGGITWYKMNQSSGSEIAYHSPDSPVNKLFKANTVAHENMPVNNNESAMQAQTAVVGSEQQREISTTGDKPPKNQKTKKTNEAKNIVAKGSTKFLKVNYEPTLNKTHRTNQFICNATPCPLEICIIQSVKCPDGGYTATSTCSILEPDESGQLKYKSFDKITKNCKASIQEIRIKRVSTGETIVLNSESPTTAQEFFNYITGEKKGDFVAGNFHTDCNNHSDDCGLTFNNDFGSLILQ